MIGLKHKNTVNLSGVIMPQGILKNQDSIYVFDKINMDEGRLYRFDDFNESCQLILEVDDGECYFGKDGYVYILYIDDDRENTFIEKYDLDGRKIMDMDIRGSVFHMDVDQKGCIYTLFSGDHGMYVGMYDSSGRFVRTLHSRNIPLLSSMSCDEEYIYLGGFAEEVPLRIEKVNHMSYIENIYDLEIKDTRFLISKILRYGEYLIVIVSGRARETIYAFDISEGNRKELDLGLAPFNYICDVYISRDTLYVVDSQKRILSYEINMETKDAEIGQDRAVGKYPQKKSYRYLYLSYIIYMKGLYRDFFSLLIKVGIPLSMAAMLYRYYSFEKRNIDLTIVDNLRSFMAFSILLAILGTVIRSVIVYCRKESRLDGLLDIYNRVDGIRGEIFKSSVFMGTALFITSASLFYNKAVNVVYMLMLTGLSCIVTAGIMYYLGIRSLERFRALMKDMVFELLSLDVKDHELFTKIGSQIKKLRKLGIEKYRIKVLTESKGAKGIEKLVLRWSILRRKITGDLGKLRGVSDYVIFDLNLKNRDIKYSRISVVEDFICYLNRKINVSSVIIEVLDEDEGFR